MRSNGRIAHVGRVCPRPSHCGRPLNSIVSRIIKVPVAHMYLFSDACPTVWLSEGKDETWHTIANFTFQSDPTKQAQVDAGVLHSSILSTDSVYTGIVKRLESQLPSGGCVSGGRGLDTRSDSVELSLRKCARLGLCSRLVRFKNVRYAMRKPRCWPRTTSILAELKDAASDLKSGEMIEIAYG